MNTLEKLKKIKDYLHCSPVVPIPNIRETKDIEYNRETLTTYCDEIIAEITEEKKAELKLSSPRERLRKLKYDPMNFFLDLARKGTLPDGKEVGVQYQIKANETLLNLCYSKNQGEDNNDNRTFYEFLDKKPMSLSEIETEIGKRQQEKEDRG